MGFWRRSKKEVKVPPVDGGTKSDTVALGPISLTESNLMAMQTNMTNSAQLANTQQNLQNAVNQYSGTYSIASNSATTSPYLVSGNGGYYTTSGTQSVGQLIGGVGVSGVYYTMDPKTGQIVAVNQPLPAYTPTGAFTAPFTWQDPCVTIQLDPNQKGAEFTEEEIERAQEIIDAL